MRIGVIPGKEPTVKTTVTFKKSVSDLLDKYMQLYQETTGVVVSRPDLIEHMLKTFMEDDKDFQRLLKKGVAPKV